MIADGEPEGFPGTGSGRDLEGSNSRPIVECFVAGHGVEGVVATISDDDAHAVVEEALGVLRWRLGDDEDCWIEDGLSFGLQEVEVAAGDGQSYASVLEAAFLEGQIEGVDEGVRAEPLGE